MNVKVRPAVVGDMPIVLELITELAVYEKEPNAVKVTLEMLIEDGFGADKQFDVLIAEMDEEIAGMALVYN